MKGMPLPFDSEGKGVLDLDLILKKNQSFFDFPPHFFGKNFISETTSCNNSSFGEPKSVLDSARFSSRPTSSSTLSSSHGGGGGASAVGGGCSTDTTNPSPKWHQQDSATATATSCSNLAMGTSGGGGGGERLAMEDWASVLSEAAPAGQQHSALRWTMGGDIFEDPYMGSALNKVLQLGGGGGNNCLEFDFNVNDGGFGAVDQENFSLGGVNLMANVPPFLDGSTPMFSSQQLPPSPMVFPLPYSVQQNDQSPFLPPQSKRHNPGTTTALMEDSSLRQISKGQPYAVEQLPGQLLPRYKSGQKPNGGEDLRQQAIVDQLYKAAELVQTGNVVLAQGILARLNHHLSPNSGEPFRRAAFYCKEALHMLLSSNNNDNSVMTAGSSPFGLIFKIGAYKSFSEISPVVQFANFTSNQAILEALEGFDRIHVVDFDIGYGGQWASLMQELSSRGGGPPSLKVTAFASGSSQDQLGLGLARENLIQFAGEVNISFEFNVLSFDSLNPGAFRSSEAIAVNLPAGALADSSQELSEISILRFVKQLSPRIIVSVDKGCHRTDLPFANHVIHALQSYSNLLESFGSVSANADELQKVERLLLQPEIEKIVANGFRAREKTQHWRASFLSSGFSPLSFSDFTESQAECIVERTHVRGFAVEKRQSSLVLCWQRKELISASAWRC